MAKNRVNEEQTIFSKIGLFCKDETVHFIIGLIIVVVSVYLLLAFSSFFFTGATDQSILEGATAEELNSVDNQIKNYAGSLGARMANYFINGCFGVSSYFIPIFILVWGLKLMKVHAFKLWKWFIGCGLLLIWSSILLAFLSDSFYDNTFLYWGGLHGYNTSRWLVSQIGTPGLSLLLLTVFIFFLIYWSSKTIIWLRKLLKFGYLRKTPSTDGTVVDDTEETPKEDDSDKKDDSEQSDEYVDPQPQIVQFTTDETFHQEEKEQKKADQDNLDDTLKDVETEDEEDINPPLEIENTEEEDLVDTNLAPYNPRLDLENYRYPTLNLLRDYGKQDTQTINMEEQNANKNKIVEVLRSFSIEISSIKATVGPTVTLYEITPAQGVRISKIRNLEDDIALSLSALGIRIIAPIPGKGTIGIEVPNSDPKTVSMQSIIASKKFQESTYDLPIAFGKTITNDVFMVDLCKMPHILVAGATGQGKSVGLNAIITSLLYKKHPSELKFVLVDPKKVEFSIYSALENHFMAEIPGEEPIITDVKKVIRTLNSLCAEMDSRYDLLKKAHVRNIKEYNEKFINRKLNPDKGHKFMPYIVVVIDEFGDLIMTAGKEVELPIARIAQLARAVGIHMIIATQRPTTNIITGTIKANFPARVAFRVSSMIDSRTILDRPGANQLIGRGDMLFLQGADPIRVQCAFVDTPEVESITQYIACQQGYTSAFALPEVNDDSNGTDTGDIDMSKTDPLFEEAARLIVIHQQGSTSLIQRKFAIGYARAGRIMDQLENAGIVGPSEGSKARQVLCTDEADLDMRLRNI